MTDKVTVSIYGPSDMQPKFEAVALDFDPRRDPYDKIYVVTLPNGDRVYIHVEAHSGT